MHCFETRFNVYLRYLNGARYMELAQSPAKTLIYTKLICFNIVKCSLFCKHRRTSANEVRKLNPCNRISSELKSVKYAMFED